MTDTQDPIRKLGETDDLQFVEKLLAYFGDELSAEQVDELSQELLADGEKRDLFVATATMQQHLRRVERSNAITEESMLGGLAPEPDDALSTLDPNDSNIYELVEMPESATHPRDKKPPTVPLLDNEHDEAQLVMSLGGFRVYRGGYGIKVRHLAMAAALMLVGVLAWAFWLGIEPAPPQPTVVARIQQSRHFAWVDTTLPRATGSELLTGRYELAKGVLELRLNRGAEVILEAPCAFELLSANAMALEHGKLVATVPPQATNFTVKTAHADFVDLGTVFGISVDPAAGDADAAVIEGRVIVNGQPEDPKALADVVELTRGQATTARSDGSIDKPAIVSNDQINAIFSRSLDMRNRIIHKSDNIKTLAVPPPSLERDQLESDDHIFLLTEQQGIVLEHDVLVDTGGIERTDDDGSTIMVVPAGQRVRSYLLHADTLREKKQSGHALYHGQLTFSSQILGVIVNNEPLIASDPLFQIDGLRFESVIERSLDNFWPEASPDSEFGQDAVAISDDRRQLRFRFKIETGIDEVRILVLDAPAESSPHRADQP